MEGTPIGPGESGIREARDDQAHSDARAFVAGAVEVLHEAGLTEQAIVDEINRMARERLELPPG